MVQNGINVLLATSIFWISWFLIIYTYIIFPIILAVLSSRFTKKNHSAPLADSDRSESLPRVAMVVAAYNEEKVISEKLNNSWAIDYPHDRFTLVVGSDGSDDKTNYILRKCKDERLRFFDFNQRRGKISVINDIMSNLNKDDDIQIIIMSDANTLFDKNSIKNLVRHFDDPKIGCVSGELILSQDGGVSGEGLYWKYECWIKSNESKLGFLIGCNGGIFAIRKEVYEPLPSSVIVEDFVMTMRLLEKGWQVKFDPEARGSEPPCPTSKAEMIRKIRIGAGNFQALSLTANLLLPHFGIYSFAYWGHKVIRWLVPFFFITALISNIMLINNSIYLIFLLINILGALIAFISYKNKMNKTFQKLVKPISYFYIMNYALLCGFFRFIFGTQRVTWDRASR